MRCPACDQPVPEQAPACPHCRFDLEAAGRYFGAPLELEDPLTDLAGSLGVLKKRALRDALLGMSQTFPQLRFAALLTPVPAEVPLAAHAFWVFNTGGLVAPQESGGLCRQVLLEIDTANARAACLIGYGLEPFIPREVLQHVAQAAVPGLRRGDPAAALLAALDAARTEFAAVTQHLTRALGFATPAPAVATGGEETAYAY